MSLKERIKSNPALKRMALHFLMHPVKARPQWWIRIFQCFYLKRGKHTVIYRSVRRDLVPFNQFQLGDYSVVEDFATVSNAVGDVIIGSHTRVGLHNTIIGPVRIGDHVNLPQGITVSALNHNFDDPTRTISEQGISTKQVTIENDVWIGANAVVLQGVTIGEHCVVAAGSIVTKDVPPQTVVGGNPARILKHYDKEKGEWVKP